MDSEEFVEAIELVVRESAVSGTLSLLQRPPGRRPSVQVKENAAWYASLNEAQRERLPRIIEAAVDQAIFGFLCVIDGVRAIENGETKGHLELLHIKEKTTVLNPPGGAMLHDLYQH